MSFLDGVRHRLRALFRRAEYERELEDEVRFHLSLDEMHAADAGGSEVEARMTAGRSFGNVTRVKEEHRRAAGVAFLDVLRQDLAFAVRSWTTRAGRGPAIVTVLTLAVGIGAMTAIYSIVQAILIRPLPVRDPERLVSIQIVEPAERGQRVYGSLVNQQIYRSWKDDATVLEGVAGFLGRYVTVTGLGPTRTTLAFEVTANLFEFLGVHPLRGRGFTTDEERPGAAPVVVLSATFASRNFGSDSGVVGRTVTLDGTVHEVVGIMPPGFRIPGAVRRANPNGDIWLPVTQFRDRESAVAASIDVIARVSRGVAEANARAHLDTILAATALPGDLGVFGKVTQMVSPHRMMIDDVRRPLLLLAAASAVLLLIACANVANVMLARAVVRRREIAVRAALGAGRARLTRQLLTESVALSLAGGSLGVLVAYAALPAILSLAGNNLPPLGPIGVDARVLAVAFLVTVLVGVAVGLAPVLESRRGVSHAALKEGAVNTTMGRWSQAASNGLVAGEVGLALLLLGAMALIARSFIGMMTLDRGYDTGAVLMGRIGVPARHYETPETRVALTRTVLERLEAIPGVASAAAANAVPLLSSRGTSFSTTGTAPTAGSPWSELLAVSEKYLITLGIPLRRGRLAASRDEVVIDEAAAGLLFPDGNPLGRRLDWGNARRPSPATSGHGIVVGVVGDIHEADATERSTQPHVYRPLTTDRTTHFAVRAAAGDPARLLPAVRAVFGEIDPDITVDIAEAVNDMLRARFAQERFLTQLMLGLAGIALFLATIGIYSVVSYATARRSREVGIRVALGAQRLDIVGLMMRRALMPVAGGVILGLGGSVAAGRVLRSQLFEVSPADPLVLITVTTLLALSAAVASYLPSRRATRIEPTVVLREE
jgi:predicted permease